MRKLLLLLSLLVLLLSGCDLLGSDEERESRLVTTGVIVGNGGNFSDQNGSLTFYDPVTDQTTTLALNAFVQSLALHQGRAYVTLNTFSVGQIAIVDVASRQLTGRIQNVPIPRYIAFANDQKAYVTNMAFGREGFVLAFNPATQTLLPDTIAVGFYPEGLVAHKGRIYVANYGSLGAGRTVSVIDMATNAIVQTLEPGCDGPQAVFIDAEEELVVVCLGKTVYNADYSAVIERTNGQIVFVNPTTGAVNARLTLEVQLGSANGTQTAYYAPEAEELYAISSGSGRIFRVNTDANALAGTITVPAASDLVGLSAVAYDAAQQRLYVARLAAGANGQPDYRAAGAVVILNHEGRQIGRFSVGPAPSHIELVQERR
jgi:DNA-binding beta-propeller fold protein YncE